MTTLQDCFVLKLEVCIFLHGLAYWCHMQGNSDQSLTVIKTVKARMAWVFAPDDNTLCRLSYPDWFTISSLLSCGAFYREDWSRPDTDSRLGIRAEPAAELECQTGRRLSCSRACWQPHEHIREWPWSWWQVPAWLSWWVRLSGCCWPCQNAWCFRILPQYTLPHCYVCLPASDCKLFAAVRKRILTWFNAYSTFT